VAGPYPQLPPGFRFVLPGQTRYFAPDSDLPDLHADGTARSPYETLRKEVNDLEMWIHENQSKCDLGTPWAQRIDSLLRLLKRRAQRLFPQTGSGATPSLVDDSISIAIEIDRGFRFAKHLRHWISDWSQSRILPPKSMQGKHIRRSTLFTDEGVIVGVREYLNAGSLSHPKGNL
jgi:hypothetical protein